MSDADDEARVEPRPPRETVALYGHAEAEGALLEAYRGGRFPHAWLIAGPAGIGKATAARLLANVYAAGNRVEPRAAYRAFRGRDATVEPMLKKLGLLAEAQPAG